MPPVQQQVTHTHTHTHMHSLWTTATSTKHGLINYRQTIIIITKCIYTHRHLKRRVKILPVCSCAWHRSVLLLILQCMEYHAEYTSPYNDSGVFLVYWSTQLCPCLVRLLPIILKIMMIIKCTYIMIMLTRD